MAGLARGSTLLFVLALVMPFGACSAPKEDAGPCNYGSACAGWTCCDPAKSNGAYCCPATGYFCCASGCCAGSGGSGGSGATGGAPDVVIAISSAQTGCSEAADPGMCPSFAPNPASVVAKHSFAFRNDGTSSYTVVGSDGTPWTTVNPGAISGSLQFDQAGTIAYGVSSCGNCSSQFVSTPYYGRLTITVN
jgi:hypothetical protein